MRTKFLSELPVTLRQSLTGFWVAHNGRISFGFDRGGSTGAEAPVKPASRLNRVNFQTLTHFKVKRLYLEVGHGIVGLAC